jgi:uncharacterized protein YacL|tara:strand:+ start:1905 stop:2072 length:168 start_codon:yes stop_codon:yes gene_type:complete
MNTQELERIKNEIVRSNNDRIRKETQGIIAGVCFAMLILIALGLYTYALVQKIGG